MPSSSSLTLSSFQSASSSCSRSSVGSGTSNGNIHQILSKEIMNIIFSFSRETLSECAQVSRQWKIMIYNPMLQQMICKNERFDVAEWIKQLKIINIKVPRIALDFYKEQDLKAASLSTTGLCYYSQGNFYEALKLHGQALKIRSAALGDKHPAVASSLNNIGNCYHSQGNNTEALKIYGEALKIRRAALGENHPAVASSLNNIGNCYHSQENYDEALKMYEEALMIRRAALGENHPAVASSLNNIGNCYHSQGNYDEALKMYGEALKIQRAALGENHPGVANKPQPKPQQLPKDRVCVVS